MSIQSLSAFGAGIVLGGAILSMPARQQASALAPVVRRDTFARVARERERSVVFLHTLTGGGATAAGPPQILRPEILQPVREGLGSGVVIDLAGLILTNAHVIEKADLIHVRTRDGEDLEATVVGADPDNDLALVRVSDPRGLQPAPLGDSDKVSVGDMVVAIGNPLGLHHTVTTGIISAKARGLDDSGLEFLQTDAAINPGSSGGPLLDLNGAVVGITTAILSKAGENVGLNFAIPINTAKAILPQLRTGAVAHGWMGLATASLTRTGARAVGAESGLVVTDLDPQGPAARAGLRAGDVLLGIAGRPPVPAREIHQRVRNASPGTTLILRVWRDRRSLEIPVVVGTMPRER